LKFIFKQEGIKGFGRRTKTPMLIHIPSTAVSWTIVRLSFDLNVLMKNAGPVDYLNALIKDKCVKRITLNMLKLILKAK
jgi:hypothetical protein